MNSKFRKILIAFIILISRFLPLPPNFSALGVYGFNNKNFFYFFSVIIAFDLIYGNLYKGIWATYLGFSIYYFLGKLANSTTKKLLLIPVCSFLFYIISNFGVWLYWYPTDLNGLIRCYINALPFLLNTLISDIVLGYGYLILCNFKKLELTKFLTEANARFK